MDIQTSMVGEIVEFFPETQTAKILLHLSDVISTEQSNYAVEEVPVLVDVPCQFPKWGKFSITGSVSEGDQCVVHFMSNGIAHWLYRGESKYKVENGRPEVASRNRYSINDAVAVVGVSNFLSPIPNYNTEDMELRNESGTQKLTFKKGGDVLVTTDKKFIVDAETEFKKAVVMKDKLDVTKEIKSDSTVTGTDCISGTVSGKTHVHTTTATIGLGPALGIISPPT